MNPHYSIMIEWSDEDQTYIVSFPEWSDRTHTHGDTLEEAARMAQELLELLIEDQLEDGKPLPQARDFNTRSIP